MAGSERQPAATAQAWSAGGVWRSTLGPCVAGALGWLPPTAATHWLDTLRVRWQLTPQGEAGPSTLAGFARATVASEGLYGGVRSPRPPTCTCPRFHPVPARSCTGPRSGWAWRSA